MNIRKILPKEIVQAGTIFTRCVREMNEAGLYNWTADYPTIREAENDQKQGTLYGAFDGDALLGFCTLDTQMVPQYETIDWAHEVHTALCIHRLAVEPTARRRGVAAALLAFAADFALSQGLTSLRVDSFSQNYRAVSLYEQSGFQHRGNIFYPGKDPRVNALPFFTFEKTLVLQD